MTTGENVLYVVEKTNIYSGHISSRLVFRTREAGLRYRRRMQKSNHSANIRYFCKRATWGPDND